MQQPILVAEDLSSFGGVSLGAAWTILNAFGFPVAGLPTSLLSTHTGGFGHPAQQSLSNWLPATLAHWQSQTLMFDTILIGYLGQPELLELFQQAIQQIKPQRTILDPVMGDQGKLYTGFDTDYVVKMRQLLPQADILLPNLTEAQLLADQTLPTDWELTDLQQLLSKLQRLSDQALILITDVPFNQQTGCVWVSETGFHQIQQSRVAGQYFGSGDVLAATLTGLLEQGKSFDQAVELAVNWLHEAIATTQQKSQDSRWGIQVTTILKHILQLS